MSYLKPNSQEGLAATRRALGWAGQVVFWSFSNAYSPSQAHKMLALAPPPTVTEVTVLPGGLAYPGVRIC